MRGANRRSFISRPFVAGHGSGIDQWETGATEGRKSALIYDLTSRFSPTDVERRAQVLRDENEKLAWFANQTAQEIDQLKIELSKLR